MFRGPGAANRAKFVLAHLCVHDVQVSRLFQQLTLYFTCTLITYHISFRTMVRWPAPACHGCWQSSQSERVSWRDVRDDCMCASAHREQITKGELGNKNNLRIEIPGPVLVFSPR